MEDDPIVAEALRRLPQEEQDLRQFRLKRAIDLSVKKAILPKDQWTSDQEVSVLIQCACTCTCTCMHVHTCIYVHKYMIHIVLEAP